MALLWVAQSRPAVAEDPKPLKSAYQIFSEMLEMGITGREIPILIVSKEGKELPVSWGGEKEGTSTMITRVLGPNKSEFKNLASALGDSEKGFLAQFLSAAVSGSIIQKNVVDMNGNPVAFDVSELRGKDFSSMNLKDLRASLDVYLEKLGDKHFSFIKPAIRRKIAQGEFPGMDGIRWSRRHEVTRKAEPTYEQWVPHYGDSERYITRAHGTYGTKGWELHLVPQKTYAEFEKLISWFRKTMGVGGNLFEAPGHQWTVMPQFALEDGSLIFSNSDELKKFNDQMGEVYRHIQAYIVLKGIEGNSRIVTANHKTVHNDATLVSGSASRGVIRMERSEKFNVEDMSTFATEMRAGTKSDPVRRFAQTMMVSRQVSRQFDDLALGSSWALVPSGYPDAKSLDLESRFSVTAEEAKVALERLTSPKFSVRNEERKIGMNYLVPFWRWENAPYLSPEKKAHLKNLTRNLIRSLADANAVHGEDALEILGTWVSTSNLIMDIENYLRPKAPRLADDGSLFTVPGVTPAVDVNKIDLGLEYTARFPLRAQSEFREAPAVSNRRLWVGTEYDLTAKEREDTIRKVAQVLAKKLTGSDVAVHKVVAGDHGHSLVVQFEFRDSQGRKWGVEWDGVGRDYDANGKIIPGSERGGHIEVVTPKHVPTTAERNAVYDTFKELSLVPSVRMGGGHVNFDLAAFDGKPKAFARFILRFLKIRRTMALTFQHPSRLASAQPHDVSSKLEQALENFNGTEEDLKKILYNERFFNTRLGRKSRYTQMDISAYFQDVIPPQFVTQDFDIKNDIFRQSFNVEPHIRKGEFRLFNAPRSAREAEMQVKFVRAMLNDALNETGPVSGKIQNVDYENSVKNPDSVLADFDKDLKTLKLDPSEYRGLFIEGLAATRDWMESEFYVPYETKMLDFPKLGGWGEAVPARSAEQAITSVGRLWDGSNPTVEALNLAERRRLTRVQQQHLIQEFDQIRGQGVFINRFDSVLPIELRFSVDEIKAMKDKARMINIIHFQLRAGKLDPGSVSYLELMQSLMEPRQDFIKAVETVLRNRSTTNQRGGELRAWVAAEFIDESPEFEGATKIAATDPDSWVRIRVWDRLKALPDAKLAEWASEISFSDVGVRRHWLEEMSTRTFEKGSPIFAKASDPATPGTKTFARKLVEVFLKKPEVPAAQQEIVGYNPVELRFLVQHADSIFSDPKMIEDRALMTKIMLRMPVSHRQSFGVSLLKSDQVQIRKYGMKLMEGMDPFDGDTMTIILELQKNRSQWDAETRAVMAKVFRDSNERVQNTTLEQFKKLDTKKAIAYAYHSDRVDWVSELKSRENLDEDLRWTLRTYPGVKIQTWLARLLSPELPNSLALAIRSVSPELRKAALNHLKGMDLKKAVGIINNTLGYGSTKDPLLLRDVLDFLASQPIEDLDIGEYSFLLGIYYPILQNSTQIENRAKYVKVVSRFKDKDRNLNEVAISIFTRSDPSFTPGKSYALLMMSQKMDPMNYEIFYKLQSSSDLKVRAQARTYVLAYQAYVQDLGQRDLKKEEKTARLQIQFEKNPTDMGAIQKIGTEEERQSLIYQELYRTKDDPSERAQRYRVWLMSLFKPVGSSELKQLVRYVRLRPLVLEKATKLSGGAFEEFVNGLDYILPTADAVSVLPWLVETIRPGVALSEGIRAGIRDLLYSASGYVKTLDQRRAYYRLMKYMSDEQALTIGKRIAENTETPSAMLQALIITMKYRKSESVRDWVRTFAVHPNLQIQSIVNSWIAVQDAQASAEAASAAQWQNFPTDQLGGLSCAEQLQESPL
ncbi:MAG: hypothetical protein JNL01_11840 [Bdellovibrionales bacterium]|nr:hypothetical protein [Bdellovibrionales bacterium]